MLTPSLGSRNINWQPGSPSRTNRTNKRHITFQTFLGICPQKTIRSSQIAPRNSKFEPPNAVRPHSNIPFPAPPKNRVAECRLPPRKCSQGPTRSPILAVVPKHSMYAIYAYTLGWFWGFNVGIYGSPMECLWLNHRSLLLRPGEIVSRRVSRTNSRPIRPVFVRG